MHPPKGHSIAVHAPGIVLYAIHLIALPNLLHLHPKGKYPFPINLIKWNYFAFHSRADFTFFISMTSVEPSSCSVLWIIGPVSSSILPLGATGFRNLNRTLYKPSTNLHPPFSKYFLLRPDAAVTICVISVENGGIFLTTNNDSWGIHDILRGYQLLVCFIHFLLELQCDVSALQAQDCSAHRGLREYQTIQNHQLMHHSWHFQPAYTCLAGWPCCCIAPDSVASSKRR
jgi:hypothetical protein